MKVTLDFDNRQSADNFMSWWLDGGGEQYLSYDSTSWDLNKGYICVEGTGENPEIYCYDCRNEKIACVCMVDERVIDPWRD